MLVGREQEISKLIENLKQGRHSLVWGAQGVGKTALLREVERRLSKSGPAAPPVVYVTDCSSSRNLLQGALSALDLNGASIDYERSSPTRTRPCLKLQDLRNLLTAAARREKLCLLLDHLPELHHKLKHLLELLEQECSLTCAVDAVNRAYPLYFWKFDPIELRDLPRKLAMGWIEGELADIGYRQPLRRAIALEVFRLSGGNPGRVARTLRRLSMQASPIASAIQVRHVYIDGLVGR